MTWNDAALPSDTPAVVLNTPRDSKDANERYETGMIRSLPLPPKRAFQNDGTITE
jgi:hypothetical protein